jgi:hypothetical protein
MQVHKTFFTVKVYYQYSTTQNDEHEHKHACLEQDSDPQSVIKRPRPMPHSGRPLWLAAIRPRRFISCSTPCFLNAYSQASRISHNACVGPGIESRVTPLVSKPWHPVSVNFRTICLISLRNIMISEIWQVFPKYCRSIRNNTSLGLIYKHAWVRHVEIHYFRGVPFYETSFLSTQPF